MTLRMENVLIIMFTAPENCKLVDWWIGGLVNGWMVGSDSYRESIEQIGKSSSFALRQAQGKHFALRQAQGKHFAPRQAQGKPRDASFAFRIFRISCLFVFRVFVDQRIRNSYFRIDSYREASRRIHKKRATPSGAALYSIFEI